MKKLTKKQGIIIGIVVAIILIVAIVLGVYFGAKTPNKTEENKGKVEKQETEETDDKDKQEDKEKEESEAGNTEVETETETEEQPETNTVEEPKQQTTTQQQSSSNTTNNQSSNSNNSGGATTTPSAPSASHTHSWTEVWGLVSVPETGEYQTVGGVTTTTWIVEKPAGTENRVVAYKCSCGETKTVPDAGTYAIKDRAAGDRLAKCVEILKMGRGSQFIPLRYEYNHVSYWGDVLLISADVTSGAWMYVNIAGWKGMGVGYETEPTYAEIQTLTKRCLEAIAPQGGTELFNKVNSLVLQYGDPRDVPTQGTVSESIPGLSVTLNQGVNGLEIRFWAE